MKNFIFSGFGDEICSNFREQAQNLKKMGVFCIEPRKLDGKSIIDITKEEAVGFKKILDEEGVGVSAIGSPIGKIDITDDFEEHFEKYKHILDLAEIFGTKNIRMFSFFIPEGQEPVRYRPEVMKRLRRLLDEAKRRGMVLCHENEKSIYGEKPEYCLDILREFGGEMRAVYDMCNFIMADAQPYPYAFELVKDYVEYIHIKDADAEHNICPAGEGIGGVYETLCAVSELRQGKPTYVTLEPHLTVFDGLDQLSAHEVLKRKYTYSSAYEAFETAVKALFAINERVK
ncbi:MAG: sugar phosphate isomerase/epimerase [Ruminococcaceae bacterium]|nr:sugar phosphate isomerase/epimerase [Oscillospiraceae bacterium]